MPLHKKRVKTKTGIKSVSTKNGKQQTSRNGKQPGSKTTRPVRPTAPAPLSEGKAQYNAFERAIALLHKKNYRDAKDMFEKARQGPSREIAANAATHVRMCERRLGAPAPEPKSAEEHYNYAIALINMRNLDPARRHLGIALEMDPRADHVHYAMGVCLALSGDAQGAYDSLRRAIELQPRNRMVARQDSDLEGISTQPRFSRLLYPEG